MQVCSMVGCQLTKFSPGPEPALNAGDFRSEHVPGVVLKLLTWERLPFREETVTASQTREVQFKQALQSYPALLQLAQPDQKVFANPEVPQHIRPALFTFEDCHSCPAVERISTEAITGKIDPKARL